MYGEIHLVVILRKLNLWRIYDRGQCLMKETFNGRKELAILKQSINVSVDKVALQKHVVAAGIVVQGQS